MLIACFCPVCFCVSKSKGAVFAGKTGLPLLQTHVGPRGTRGRHALGLTLAAGQCRSVCSVDPYGQSPEAVFVVFPMQPFGDTLGLIGS